MMFLLGRGLCDTIGAVIVIDCSITRGNCANFTGKQVVMDN